MLSSLRSIRLFLKLHPILNYQKNLKIAVNDKMSQLKNEINDTIASAIDQNLDLLSSSTEIDQLKSATEGTLNSLTELIASCHTTLDQMSSGAGSFAEATQSLSSLSETLETLQNSLSALSAGSLQLTQGLTSFQHGIEQLSEGSSTLSQGATKLGTAGKEAKRRIHNPCRRNLFSF